MISGEGMGLAGSRDVCYVGGGGEAGKLLLEGVHGVGADGVVGCADFEEDFALLEVGGWVDLVAAPGFHVGRGCGDGRVHVVHA